MLRRLLLNHFFLTVLAVLSAAEVGLLLWVRFALGQPVLGPLWILGLIPAIGLANAAVITALRRLGGGRFAGHVLSRMFLVASLGALLSGILLVLVSPPMLLAQLVVGTTSLGDALLAGAGGVAVALGFGSIFWGFALGQRWLVVEQVSIPMRGLEEAHEGLTITHISDIHIGPQLSGEKLRALVERVNAQEADLIAITGDIFDSDPSFIDEGCRTLAGLHARHGVFACLGNHDVYTGVEAVTAGLAKHTSIRVLRDEWVRVDVRGEPVYVLGLDDPGRGWAGRSIKSEALARICQEVPDAPARVLLTHRPTYFRQIAELRVPLAIAGHTHGGQVTLPPPGHHHNISRLVTEWTRGLFEQAGSLLYVNRGLGVAGLPVRLNCPREIALLRLTART